jgi:hypothetical protein
LLYSLNTWGYIEFDDLCELSNLDNILFDRSSMPCLSHAIFYIAGKYNEIGQYLVHRVYISSIYGVSSHCENKILVCSQEEEKLLFPCTLVEASGLFLEDQDKTLVMNINHEAKPRTVCCQQGENDENITRSDMTMLKAPATKVKLFHIVTTFDIEELILCCKVCMFLFVELLTWVKQCVECTRKALKNKKVDWGPSNDIYNIPTQATMSLGLKPYLGEEYTLESRMTLPQEGEDDEDIAAINTTTPATPSPFNQRPMTRAHACKLNY